MSDFDPEPSDRPVIEYRAPRKRVGTRATTWLKFWARETFSREQLVSSLKSLAWVAPLTIVIWVYAEREQLAKVQNQTIPITMKSVDPKLIVTIIDPADQNITADMAGPRISVDKVSEQLKMIPKSDQGVMIEIPVSYAPGRYTIPTSVVSNADLFKRAGVTLSSPSPANLHVEIDRIVDREVDVQVPPDLTNLAGTPTFEPRTVHISGPQAVLDAASARGQLAVFAQFKGFNELRVPGKHEIANVPLKLAFDDKTSAVYPAVVKVSLEVRQLEVEWKRDAMPVYVTYPQVLNKNYRAEFDATLPNVTFIGPSEQIEAMKRPDFEPQPKARFEVSQKDLPDGVNRTAHLQFDLPPGVHMSADDEKRTIDFKLVKLATQE